MQAEGLRKREQEATRKAREGMHEAQRKYEELEDSLPSLQAEKQVCKGMVHQLMSQLSKARMDKALVLKGQSASMSIPQQHAHLQQLLLQAKSQSHQMSALVDGVISAKQEA